MAATKYVAPDDLGALAEAGIDVVGENRAQDLAAKHALHGDAFRWHFIGHLQSRKAAIVNELCELCHSLSSASAAKRLTIPALVEVNLSGEESKSGIPERELEDFLPLYANVVGLMTMPPFTSDPEDSRPYFRRLRELAEQHGRRRRGLLGIRVGPVVEVALPAPRGQPADVRALAVGALEILLGQVAVLVPVVVLLGDPEVDERPVPNVCKSHG